MRFAVILDIAKTHLLSRPKQTVVAALGVTFGIGTFITLMSFMTGLNHLLDGLILNSTPHVHIFNEIEPSEEQPVDVFYDGLNSLNKVHSIQPKQSQPRIPNALPIMSMLKNDPTVKGASPRVTAPVFYVTGAIRINGMVNGIDPPEENRLFHLNDYMINGSLDKLVNNSNGILLGAGIAKKMAVGINDRIQLTTADGNVFALKVVGIYQTGLAEIDDKQSYTNLSTAQRILGEPDNYITDINVKLYDIEGSVEMSKSIQHRFGLTAIDINTANAQFETGTDIRNIITYSVSITLLLVAGFGIYNILNMLIYEKMNDIAILKATGFSGKDVHQIFISQAVIIGISGGIIGLLIGYVLSVMIANTPFETEALPTIKTFPVNFNPAFYVIGIVFAMVSTFLAGYLPARRARKLDPVEIIRG